jgi:hypothetical protein
MSFCGASLLSFVLFSEVYFLASKLNFICESAERIV